MKHTPDKILIVLHGAIGDVTRALPMVSRIRLHWPDTEIHWAVEPASKGILDSYRHVDRIIVFNRRGGFSAFLSFIKELRQEKYPLVLDLQRHFKSGLTSFLTGAPKRLGFNRKGSRELNWLFSNLKIEPVEKYSSKTEQFQKFGDSLELPKDENFDFGLQYKLSEANSFLEAELEASTDRQFVGLILGSSWPSRFWLPEYYSDLICLLNEKFGFKAVLIGGPGEKIFASDILTKIPESYSLDLVAKTSLSELPWIFSKMKFAIGSDSGPMHIAAAAGIPVISFWGATSPLRSSPWGSEEFILESNTPCAPCYKKNCPGLDMICMKSIKPEAVEKKIHRVLETFEAAPG